MDDFCDRIVVHRLVRPARPGPDNNVPVPVHLRIIVVAGTHGNEPAGSLLLLSWMARYGDALAGWLRPHVELVLVPALNPCGIVENTRAHPVSRLDLNRAYSVGKNDPVPPAVNTLRSVLLEKGVSRTWVIDLHEGWGWRTEGRGSMGSAVYYRGPAALVHQGMIRRLERLVDRVSSIHHNSGREFMLERDTDGPAGTLGEYVASLGEGYGYVLLETTGHRNIQKPRERMDQVHTVLRGLLVDVLDAADAVCGTCGNRTFPRE